MLWDTATGKAIGEPLKGHEFPITSVVFNPNGKVIVSGSYDNIRLWDAATGKPIGEPIKGQGAVTSVAFSPEGKTFVSGSEHNTLRLWDAATDKPIGEALTGHEESVTSANFSPDAKTIASVSGEDNTLRLWDAATHKIIGEPIKVNNGQVITFSPDGKVIFLSGSGGAIQRIVVFDGWADNLCRKLERNMSHKEWREQVSPDIDYIEQCPGLPIPPDKPESTAAQVSN